MTTETTPLHSYKPTVYTHAQNPRQPFYTVAFCRAAFDGRRSSPMDQSKVSADALREDKAVPFMPDANGVSKRFRLTGTTYPDRVDLQNIIKEALSLGKDADIDVMHPCKYDVDRGWYASINAFTNYWNSDNYGKDGIHPERRGLASNFAYCARSTKRDHDWAFITRKLLALGITGDVDALNLFGDDDGPASQPDCVDCAKDRLTGLAHQCRHHSIKKEGVMQEYNLLIWRAMPVVVRRQIRIVLMRSMRNNTTQSTFSADRGYVQSLIKNFVRPDPNLSWVGSDISRTVR